MPNVIKPTIQPDPNKKRFNSELKRDAAAITTPEERAAVLLKERMRQQNGAKEIKQTAQDQLQDERSGAMYNSVAGTDALAALRAARSPEAQQVISRAQDLSQGLNAQENSALRHNYLSTINSQNQGALRALHGQQAANGVRGGVAGAQLAQQNAQASSAIGQAEGALVQQNIAAKNEGLKNFANIVNTQENTERDQATDKLSTLLAIRGNKGSLEAARLQASAPAPGK